MISFIKQFFGKKEETQENSEPVEEEPPREFNLDGFESKSVRRYVRDDLEIFTGDRKEYHFLKFHDVPGMEEIESFSYESDPRIALLLRKKAGCVKPWFLREEGEEKITYGSNIDHLNLSFGEKQYLLFSEQENGEGIFTIHFNYRLDVKIDSTSDEEKTGKVEFQHRSDLSNLIESHIDLLQDKKVITDSNLYERALDLFENVVKYSDHGC